MPNAVDFLQRLHTPEHSSKKTFEAQFWCSLWVLSSLWCVYNVEGICRQPEVAPPMTVFISHSRHAKSSSCFFQTSQSSLCAASLLFSPIFFESVPRCPRRSRQYTETYIL